MLIFSFIALLLAFPYAAFTAEECKIHGDQPSLSPLPLTPLWAQEVSGILDANLFLKQLGLIDSLTPASVMVFDSLFDPSVLKLGKLDHFKKSTGTPPPEGSHGNRVVSNLLGFDSMASSHLAALDMFLDVSNSDEFGEKINKKTFDVISSSVYQFDQVTLSTFQPFLTCNLEETCTKKDIRSYFEKVFEKQALVIAAGNNYPSLATEAIPEMHAIQVGAFSEIGTPAGYSNGSENVNIYAPAGNSMLSYDQNKYTLFGGTSGAQPLVAGTIATAKALIKSLTTQEVRKLLTLTATQYFDEKGTVPVLNALRFIKVVMKLKQAHWEQLSPDKKVTLLRDRSILDFEKESDESFKIGLEQNTSDDCEMKKLGLTNLRKAFLLSGSDKSRAALISVYDSHNLHFNSFWYKNLAQPLLQKKISFTEAYELFKSIKEKSVKFGLFKYLIQNFPDSFLKSFDLSGELSEISKMPKTYFLSLLYENKSRPIKKRQALLERLLNDPQTKEKLSSFILFDPSVKYFLLERADYEWILNYTLQKQDEKLSTALLQHLSYLKSDPAPSNADSNSEEEAFYWLPSEKKVCKALASGTSPQLKKMASILLKSKVNIVNYWAKNGDVPQELLLEGGLDANE